METETVVVQVKLDGEWRDYARCTPGEAVDFLEHARYGTVGREYRAVDWITKRPLSAVDLDERVDRMYFDGTRKPECEGHESLSGAHMGESVYCDGKCAA